MAITDELIKNVLDVQFEDIPKEFVERQKLLTMDAIGCNMGGSKATGCDMMVDLIKETGGAEQSTILASGVRAPSENVAMANAMMSRSFDYGPVEWTWEGLSIPSHITECLTPVGLAVCEDLKLGGKDFLAAMIMGEDLVGRLMAACRRRGEDAVDTFGAAAVTAKLMGLSEEQLSNAFGICLGQLGNPGPALTQATHTFKLVQALAAHHGIFSAKLASKSFTGVKDAITGTGGYIQQYFPNDPRYEYLTKDLGKHFLLTVTFKPYPCCRATHASIDCTLAIIDKYHIKAEDVEKVDVIESTHQGVKAVGMPFAIKTVPHVSAIFSIPYTVASSLLRGLPVPEHFNEDAIRDPKVMELSKKVTVSKAEYPGESHLATTVVIKMKDGKEYSHHVSEPSGHEDLNPSTMEYKRNKFLHNIEYSESISQENAKEVLDMINRLEDVKDMSEIIRLLVPQK